MTIGELLILLNIQTGPGWNKALKVIGAVTSATQVLVRAGRGLASMIESAAEGGTHLMAYSQAMGLSVQRTQEWGYVAQQSGSNLKEFTTGISMFEANLRKFVAGRGSKDFKDAMRSVGITRGEGDDILHNSEKAHESLFQIADRMHALKDVPAGGVLSSALFGRRAGRAFTADLERGGAALREMQAHFRSLGGELDTHQVQSLRSLNNTINDSKLAFGGLVNQIVAKMAPALIELLQDTIAWIRSNRELIGGVLTAAVNALTTALRVLGKVVGGVAVVFGLLADHGDLARAVLIGIAGAITIMFLPALVRMAAAAWAAAVPILLMAAEFIFWAAAIGVVAYAIVKLVELISGGLGETGDVWDKLGDSANDAGEVMKGMPGDISRSFSGIGDRIMGGFGNVFEDIKHKAREAAASLLQLGFGGVDVGGDIGAARARFNADRVAAMSQPQRVNSPGGIDPWAGSSAAAARGGGATHIEYGPTTVHIDAKNADAKGVKTMFDNDRRSRELRHAAAATGD